MIFEYNAHFLAPLSGQRKFLARDISLLPPPKKMSSCAPGGEGDVNLGSRQTHRFPDALHPGSLTSRTKPWRKLQVTLGVYKMRIESRKL